MGRCPRQVRPTACGRRLERCRRCCPSSPRQLGAPRPAGRQPHQAHTQVGNVAAVLALSTASCAGFSQRCAFVSRAASSSTWPAGPTGSRTCAAGAAGARPQPGARAAGVGRRDGTSAACSPRQPCGCACSSAVGAQGGACCGRAGRGGCRSTCVRSGRSAGAAGRGRACGGG